MQRALVFAGYDVTNVWGTGAHSGAQASAIFPDVMRWLWRDWPQPVQAGKTLNDTLTNILIPGEDWQLVCEVPGGSDGPAADAKGEVFFSEVRSNRIWKVSTDGQREIFSTNVVGVTGAAFGPDGWLYTVGKSEKVLARLVFTNRMEPKGEVEEISGGLRGNDICIAHNGNIYVTDSTASATNGVTKVWLIKSHPHGEKSIVDTGLKCANGIALSPDQSLLYVSDYRSHWVYSYVIQPDGSLTNKQRYYWLHERDVDDDAGPDGMRCDRAGRLYVATRMGVQVCDQAGRVQCILPTPNGRVVNLTFGGEKFDTLFATCGDKVFKRKLNVTGANGWDNPNKPAAPRL
jgi:sugar lactone lactonase YvrE